MGENPYAPPSADLTPPPSAAGSGSTRFVLASRWARLFGSILDGFVMMTITVPILWLTGFWERAITNSQAPLDMLLGAVIGIVAFIVVNAYLLHTAGQTVGKRIVGTRIVSVHDNTILPLYRVFLMRYFPIQVISAIPFLGSVFGLLDPLFIFREDKRCLHDHIAGTRVIDAR